MSTKKKFRAFVRRVKNGHLLSAVYLSWYYSFLSLYDVINRTDFSNSQTPEEGGVPEGGTGNFPVHPLLVRRYLRAADLEKNDRILDVGHGSGIVLHVASRMGFKNLTGVEFSDVAYARSLKNLGDRANLIHGNAMDLDISLYDVIFFFNPFRGEMASRFFEKVVSGSVRVIVTVNHDPVIDPILERKYKIDYRYQHFFYKNFNCKIWLKR